MMIEVLDQKNKKLGAMDLPKKIFGAKWNPDLVHQALRAQLANQREKIAHTKGRGDVRGGGKKPWRQKGTGRSRQGSIRSPLWKGGGVAFGPLTERNFSKKINKKMKRQAVFSVLSKKLKGQEIKVIDNFALGEFKTKALAAVLKVVLGNKYNALIIASGENKNIKKAAGNIEKVDAISPKSLNVYDLLRHKDIILEKNAIKEIAEHYSKRS